MPVRIGTGRSRSSSGGLAAAIDSSAAAAAPHPLLFRRTNAGVVVHEVPDSGAAQPPGVALHVDRGAVVDRRKYPAVAGAVIPAIVGEVGRLRTAAAAAV